ncbi:MAG: DUF1214 domain-containing protein [Hyphomicrobiaceae bacterium]
MLLRAIANFINLVLRGAVFLAIAVLGGFGSAWALIHSGSRLTAATSGQWVTWTAAGRADADPYTRAHIVRTGDLPLNTTLALSWRAQNDLDGNRIHSSCSYALDLSNLDASWWSLSVFDDRGQLIPNPANRHAFNSSTLVRDADGSALVILGRDARAGNWLPTAGAGRMTLVLQIQDPRWVAAALKETNRAKLMPVIRTVSCR